MPITRTDFDALTDELESIWNETAKTEIAKMVGNQLFDVRDTDHRVWDHRILHGLNSIAAVAEGADLPEATTLQGDTISLTQTRYGGLVVVTKDMRLFERFDQIESIVRSNAEAAFHMIDQSMADVLGRGFSATSYTDVYGQTVAAVGPDGLALFSASHSNPINANTFRNHIQYPVATNNPALSREAVVQARVDAFTYLDPEGLNRPIRLDTLIIAPASEDLAIRITQSSQVTGSAENDINPLKGKVNVLPWERLQTRSDGTDTSAYWYMADSSKVKESLKCLFAERPSMDAPEQVYENKNWEWSVDYYYVLGRGFPAYIWGSDATG